MSDAGSAATHAEARAGRSGLIRHTRRFPCEVFGGHAELPHRRGVRCAGFTLTREGRNYKSLQRVLVLA